MANKKLSQRKEADRALCQVGAANIVQLKVHEVARFMREVGVTEQLTTTLAKAWKQNPDGAPEWFTRLLAECAVREAVRIAREERLDFEYQHKMVILDDKVESFSSLERSTSVTRMPS